jgi:hypothetical protein
VAANRTGDKQTLPVSAKGPKNQCPHRFQRRILQDLDPQGIEEHERVNGFERPGLSGGNVTHDHAGDAADEIGTDLDVIHLQKDPYFSTCTCTGWPGSPASFGAITR